MRKDNWAKANIPTIMFVGVLWILVDFNIFKIENFEKM